MRLLKNLFTVTCLSVLAMGSAEAGVLYDWSYEFDSGVTLTGTFDGTLGGDLDTITVSSVSNVAVDGTPYVNPLFVISITDANGGSGPALVSISGALMDLCADTLGTCFGDGFYFDTVNGFGAATDLPAGTFTGIDFPFDPTAWSIQARAVPEPATLALLGFGLAGYRMSRRRRRTV